MPSSLFGTTTNQTTNNQTTNLQTARNMMSMLRNSQTPKMLLMNMIRQNSQMQDVMNIVNQYGGDPKTAFYETAKARGIDPNQILSMLR